ncbi:MAG: tail fiber protein [Polyangiaceae bacterium]
MSDPFVGEIRMFGGNFAPIGWAFCNGQLVAISENETLFTLLGTTYGGDGVTTFALPDLRGRLPIHQGAGGGGNYTPGQAAGVESVTLTANQMPAHLHTITASTVDAETASPAGALFAASSDTPFYGPSVPGKGTTLHPTVLGAVGGTMPHDNMMPYLAVSFIIALEGIFPSQG